LFNAGNIPQCIFACQNDMKWHFTKSQRESVCSY